MMKRVLCLMIFVLLFATVAEAQQRRPRTIGWKREGTWDLGITTRYSWGKDYDFDGGSQARFHDDLGWGFSLGYNFSEHFNLGFAFAWRSVGYDATVLGLDENDEPTSRETGGQVTTSNFGLNGEYNVLKGRFTPYVNGTWSWMHINSNVFAGWTSGCWWYPYYGYVCGPIPVTYGTNTSAYSLGLGVRYELKESLYLRLGYERGWINEDSFDSTDMLRVDIGFML